MSESPEPPPKKSTSGRIISAMKQKLTAPISMFVKAVHPKKKAKVTESSDVASSVQETGTAS
jgi:plasmid rolling circle replication initiator protein Rep